MQLLLFFDMHATQAESLRLFPAEGQGDHVHRWEWHDLCEMMDEVVENLRPDSGASYARSAAAQTQGRCGNSWIAMKSRWAV